MKGLEGRVVSLEQARVNRDRRRQDAATAEFFAAACAGAGSKPGQTKEGERAAAALWVFLNSGGGGDEAA